MFSPIASAKDIFDFSGSITAANPTQAGRLSRGGQQQDWSEAKSTTILTINTGTIYNYTMVTLAPSQLGNGRYVQIEIEDPNTSGFASTYPNAYNPVNMQTNFLGDEGNSGDYFFNSLGPAPYDPRYFQVMVPTGNSLVCERGRAACVTAPPRTQRPSR